ncbi:MAG: choice-of-anchor L domain-containing protein [Moheibacter sp.]
MRGLLFFIKFLLYSFLTISYAQSIAVNPTGSPESSMNAEDLTVDVLIDGGACSEITNFQIKENPSAQYPSPNRSWGYFEKGTSAFPFERGIVLTSGYAKDAEGPNTGIVSQGEYNWSGDSQANVLAGGTTYNATVFEFDFVPFGDHISFNYIFASEEYPGFVCMNYNDVFGFIISGPGIVNDPGLTGKNIALLPNGDPVTINNVNDQWCGDSTYYVGGPFPYIQYGGRTAVMTAESDVIPGQTYHIRLLIADTSDNLYDSAVFLEAGSFSLGSTLSDIEGANLGDDKDVCGATEFTIVANVDAPGATYQWYKDGVMIAGETDSSITVTTDGYYSVIIVSASCQTEVGVHIQFVEDPIVAPHEEFRCSATGSYIFDLSDYNSSISTTTGAHFSYYHSFAGAQAAFPGDEITDFQNFTVTTGTTVVYVRVQTGTDCFQVAELTLEVGIGPETGPRDYELCDDNGDGFMSFDLTTQGPLMVLSDPTGLTYEYYLDAATTQLIPNPGDYTNISNPQTIYVKIYDPSLGEEACASVNTLKLIVHEFPELQPDTVSYCDNLNDNSEIINLNLNNIVVTPGIDVSYHYFETMGGTEIPDPENYEVTSSPTAIYVLIRNEDGSCEDYQTLTIEFNPATEVQNSSLTECSLDDFAQFDLSQAINQTVTDPTGLDFGFYLSFDDAKIGDPENTLPNDYNNISNPQTVYIRVENADGCYNISELLLTVANGPENLPFEEKKCDDNGDGVSNFNLVELAPNLLVGSTENIEFGYYLDEGLTQLIPTPTDFSNTTNPQTVYISLIDTTDPNLCVSIGKLTLKVNEFPAIQPDEISICDNLNDNTEIIDLTQNHIVLTPGIDVSLHYFETMGGTEITNPTNYEVTYTPAVIYVLVRNSDGSCEDYQTITINFNLAPDVTEDLILMENCSLTDYTQFYLPDLNANLVADTSGLNFTYHLTLNDALTGANPLPEAYQNVEPDQIIFIRVENGDGCFDIGRAQLSAILRHEQLSDIIEVCDDPYEVNDGISSFDLTQFHTQIENALGGTDYTIKYFTNLEDAVSGNNPISDPANYQNQTSPQTIYAQASSGQGGCAGVVDFEIRVLQVPEFELPDFVAFCIDEPQKTYQFGGNFDTYVWYDSAGNPVATGPLVNFSSDGIYMLEVTLDELDCPARREIEVIFDSPPVIHEIKVNENNASVYASGGFGPYQYSINNGLTWGSSGVFHNMDGGIYEMLVMSKYGCISEAKKFAVLGIPNFISPNGDGKNDTWFIRGLEAYPNSHVQIFDRYGKMFVDRKIGSDFVWDGKYKGEPVSGGDYWYIITLEDGTKISGHISVRNN